MAGLSVNVSEEAVQESAKANTFTRYRPRPVGNTNLKVYEAEIVEFTKNDKSPYYGEKAISLDLVGELEPYAKAHFFVRVPLFSNWKPKTDDAEKLAKWPNGFPTDLVPFLTAVGAKKTKTGFDVDLNGMLGKEVNVFVGLEADSYGLNKDIESEEPDALELVALRENPDEDPARLADLEELYSRNTVGRFKPADKKLAAIAKAEESGLADVDFDN